MLAWHAAADVFAYQEEEAHPETRRRRSFSRRRAPINESTFWSTWIRNLQFLSKSLPVGTHGANFSHSPCSDIALLQQHSHAESRGRHQYGFTK